MVSTGIPCAVVKLIRPKTKLVVRLGGDFLWEKAYNNNWTKKPLSSYYRYSKNIHEKMFLFIYKFVLNKCDKIIFSTNWQKEIYEQYLGYNKKEYIVIENAFSEIKVISKNNNKNILFAGRLIKIKNIEIVLEVVKNINKKLIVVGEGPLKKKLEKNKNIILKNKMNRNELMEEIASSYLIIMPSISDVSPNIVLECIKLHKPVLVTRESSFYDKYKNDLIFIDPFSKKDIEEKINFLFNEDNYNNYLNKLKNINTQRSFAELADEYKILFNESN